MDKNEIADRIKLIFDNYFKNKKEAGESHGLVLFQVSKGFGYDFELELGLSSGKKELLKPFAMYYSEMNKNFNEINKEKGNSLKISRINLVPDIVIDIQDKNTKSSKKEIYGGSGISEYWEINTDKNDIIVYRLSEDKFKLKFYSTYYPGDKVKTPIMKGFALSIHDVFNTRVSL